MTQENEEALGANQGLKTMNNEAKRPQSEGDISMTHISPTESPVNPIDQYKDEYVSIKVSPSERVDLLDMGYEPVPLLGKRPVIKGWTEGPITPQRLKEWSAAHPDHTNTGMRCGRLAIVDNDVWDTTLETEVEVLITQHLGPSMRRVGQKGGQRFYQTETPCAKMSVSYIDVNGDKQKVEILGQGQHGAVFGIHPDTLQPFKWLNGKSPKDIPFFELPEVTPEKLEGMIRAIEKLFVAKGFSQIKVSGLGDAEKTESKSTGEPVTVNELEAVFAYVDPVCDRNTWVGFAGALHNTKVINADGTEADYDKDDLWLRYCRGEMWKGPKDGWHNDGSGVLLPLSYVSDNDAAHAFNTTSAKEGGTGFGTLKRNARSNGYYESLMERFGGDEDADVPDDYYDVDGLMNANDYMAENIEYRHIAYDEKGDGVIPDHGIVGVVSPYASGKSTFIDELGYSLATGTPWLGKYQVERRVVINCPLEDEPGSHDRMRAWHMTHYGKAEMPELMLDPVTKKPLTKRIRDSRLFLAVARKHDEGLRDLKSVHVDISGTISDPSRPSFEIFSQDIWLLEPHEADTFLAICRKIHAARSEPLPELAARPDYIDGELAETVPLEEMTVEQLTEALDI